MHRDRILKARAAWLIGQWVSSDEDAARLQVVWQMLLHLLTVRQDESSDMAVTISAAMALKECIDVSSKANRRGLRLKLTRLSSLSVVGA
jgi:hypothetical protein